MEEVMLHFNERIYIDCLYWEKNWKSKIKK